MQFRITIKGAPLVEVFEVYADLLTGISSVQKNRQMMVI